MWGLTVTSWDNPVESMCDCFHLHCQAGGWDLIGCTVFVDSGRTLLNSEAPPWLVFGDWAISVDYEILRLAVFLNELPDLGIRFACWPFSTVPSQVFWQECLIEVPESVWVLFPFLVLLSVLSAGILAVFTPLLGPSMTCPVLVCCLLCLSRIHGVGCGNTDISMYLWEVINIHVFIIWFWRYYKYNCITISIMF